MDEKDTKDLVVPVVTGIGRAIRREPRLQPPAEPTPEMREVLRRLELAERELRRPG